MTSKRKSQLKHAIRRAHERFGFELSKSDIQTIVKKITSGESIPIERQSNRVTIHTLWYNEQHLKVAYDKIRKSVITVMYVDDKDIRRYG